MNIRILKEAGYEEAMLGLSLNMDQNPNDMPMVASRLSNKEKGHNKFLEQLVLWVDMTAPRYFWSQFDTYRIGVSKQSQSTMHTGLKKKLTVENFHRGMVQQHTLDALNALIEDYPNLDNEKKALSLDYFKALLPEGFLQRRVVSLNYKSLRNILAQRRHHKLKEWREFCEVMYAQCQHPQYIEDLMR